MAGILPSAGPAPAANVLRVTPARTFPQLLAQRLQHDPGQPLLTSYDETPVSAPSSR